MVYENLLRALSTTFENICHAFQQDELYQHQNNNLLGTCTAEHRAFASCPSPVHMCLKKGQRTLLALEEMGPAHSNTVWCDITLFLQLLSLAHLHALQGIIHHLGARAEYRQQAQPLPLGEAIRVDVRVGALLPQLRTSDLEEALNAALTTATPASHGNGSCRVIAFVV